jgi:hypothetical protein
MRDIHNAFFELSGGKQSVTQQELGLIMEKLHGSLSTNEVQELFQLSDMDDAKTRNVCAYAARICCLFMYRAHH